MYTLLCDDNPILLGMFMVTQVRSQEKNRYKYSMGGHGKINYGKGMRHAPEIACKLERGKDNQRMTHLN